MKARDLKPGMIIARCPSEPGLEGWTVVTTWPNATADFWYGDEQDGEFCEEVLVLLKLERIVGQHGTLDEPERYYLTRTAWLEADAEAGDE